MLIDEYSYVTKRCGFSTVMPLIHHEWWLRLELRQLQDPNIAFLDVISGNSSLKQESWACESWAHQVASNLE